MNLIQIQEHLKDMPIKAVMEYANGKSVQVPPYLALGELNRRKQMEQSAKTPSPPDSSVKERLEKELTGQAADLMQAGAARQAQSNEAMQQGIMAQPQPVPEGTPQPPQPEEEMPQMAGGGLTALPVNDMFKFAGGGGVVAFANGDVVDEFSAANPEFYKPQLEQNIIKNEERQRIQNQKELMDKIKFLETAAPEIAERLKRERASELPQAAPAKQGIAYDPAKATLRKDFPPLAAPPPPMAAPGGGIPSGISMPTAPSITAPDVEAYDTKLAEFKRKNPGLAGSEYQALLERISKQDEADRARFAAQEKGRAQSDFFRALIDAGEATRGQKGIGALFAGFGRSSTAAQAAADERENAQMKLRREQDLGMAKIRAELEAARRAEARGDFEAAFKHRQDAEKIGMDLKQKEFSNQMEIAKLKEQARGNTIQAASINRAPALIQGAQELMNRTPGMTFNEAAERYAALSATGQYQTAAQRERKALMDAMNEQTKYIDMQLSVAKPGSSEEKALITQREAIMQRFMESQKFLAGGQQTDPNTPTPGFGQARPK